MVWMLWAVWVLVLGAGLCGVVSTLRTYRTQLWVVAAIGVIAFVTRGGASTEYFYGLEYEDAFIYAEASRHLSATTVVWNSPGLAVCAIGDSSGCAAWETYPGHLFGFPALLSGVLQFRAFHPALVPQVVVALSTLTAIFVVWAAATIHRSAWKGALAGALFAVTPALALYGGAAVSEAASSAVIAVALGAVGMAQGKDKQGWWTWHGVALCASMLAITVRRENVVLLAIIPTCLLIGRRSRFRWSSIWPWLVLLTFAAGRVAGSLASEVGEYGRFSFSAAALLQTLPLVLGALLNPRWFGFVAVLAVVGFWFAVREVNGRDNLRKSSAIIGAGLVAGTMILLYASHVRSTYQLYGIGVEPFDFLRYLNNIGVPLCVVAAGAGGYFHSGITGGVRRTLIVGVLALYIVVSGAAALQIRAEMTATEERSRRQPALKALEAAASFKGEYPIVTLEPLVAQIYARDRETVISLPALTSELVEAYDGKLLFLDQEQYHSEVDRNRYGRGFAALPTSKPIEVSRGDGWSIVRWP
jgi:hypothetical protein